MVHAAAEELNRDSPMHHFAAEALSQSVLLSLDSKVQEMARGLANVDHKIRMSFGQNDDLSVKVDEARALMEHVQDQVQEASGRVSDLRQQMRLDISHLQSQMAQVLALLAAVDPGATSTSPW